MSFNFSVIFLHKIALGSIYGIRTGNDVVMMYFFMNVLVLSLKWVLCFISFSGSRGEYSCTGNIEDGKIGSWNLFIIGEKL